jgi:hypothetical protein
MSDFAEKLSTKDLHQILQLPSPTAQCWMCLSCSQISSLIHLEAGKRINTTFDLSGPNINETKQKSYSVHVHPHENREGN